MAAGLVSSAVAGVIVLPSPPASLAVGSSITGTAFQDFNSNGEFDAAVTAGAATDIGLAGVMVRAFDSAGTEVGSSTTAADGTYTMSITSEPGTPLRVEFESPTTGPLAELQPSFEGVGNGTTVQFVDAGDANVDVGYNIPGEYCQSNPSLAVSRLCAGESLQVSGNPSIFVNDYDGGPYTTANGFSDVYTSWPINTAGESDETGAVLGMAWDSNTRRIYNTAYIRRHAEVYESGGKARPGALFVTTPQSDGTGGSTQYLVDLEDLAAGDQFSNSTSGQLGYIPTNATRQLNRILDGTSDGGSENDGVDSDLVSGKVGVYEEVGQTGIGDIEVDDEGNLYVVSLYTKELYKVTMPTDGSAPTTMESLGDITTGVTCTNGEGRPFSITRWRGALYLGLTCDGSGDFPANPANYSATTTLDTNITFTVLRYDLETSQFSTFFGPQSLAGIVKGSADGTSSNWAATARRWNPWTNTYPTTKISGVDVFGVRPVPMFSDIEFDSDGSMILGFRDRNGDQLATNGAETPIGGYTSYPSIASGDIYRVCRTGTGYTAADYVFEGVAGCTQTSNASNGTEYYTGDKYFSYHYEISTGMIDQVPGFPDVVLTAFDPYDGDGSGKTFYSGGTRYIRNSTGGNAPSFPNAGSGVLYFANAGNALNPNTAGGFLKTNGMSDVEALCDAAPVQIGNYVWIDPDEDGIQDPDETPVEGATVRLYADDGTTLLGTAITDADGEYYFSSNITEPTAGNGDNAGGGLVVGEAHVVRLDEASDYQTGGPLDGLLLTAAVQGTKTTIDSNATEISSYPQISVPARSAGENDHTFDVGFVPPIVGFGNYVWIDTDLDGIQDVNESPLAGVVVNALDDTGAPLLDGNGDPITATTDANGFYFIDGLSSGNYQAEFELPVGYAFTSDLTTPGGTDSNADPDTGVTPTFTIAASAANDTTLDTDAATTAELANLTIDAGVVPLVGMGDFTWIDSDEDGIQDASETPLANVVVTLYETNGTTPATDAAGHAATDTTDANGEYFIDGLLPGDYRAEFELPIGYVFTTDLAPPGGTDSNPDPDTGLTPTFTIAASVVADTDAESDASTLAQFVNPTIDAGVVPLVGMGDYTWKDYDSDGVQEAGEPPLQGVMVTLYESDGTTPATNAAGGAATDTTDANGYYFIDGLVPGEYTAEFELPTGYVFTDDGGGSTSDDSNPDPTTGMTPVFDITPRAEGDTEVESDAATLASFVNPTVDAGVVSVVSISNYFWFDLDADGVRDLDEPPVVAGTVELLDPNEDPATDADGAEVVSVTTDADGFFRFDNLLPGDYRLRFTPPPGYTFTTVGTDDSDADSNAERDGLTAVFTVAGQPTGSTVDDTDGSTVAVLENPTVGAGLIPRVAIGDYTWVDIDRVGDQTDSEPMLPGVTVELLDDSGDPAVDADGAPVPATVTDDDGLYNFDNLYPGDYQVRFTAPDGYVFTTQGTDSAEDSNPVTETGVTPVFTVEPTETGATRSVTPDDGVSVALLIDPTIDAGFVQLVGMGDYTWVDENMDGLQDADEPVLAGVTVTLFESDGVTPVDDVFGNPATAITDDQGYYFIDDLVPGDYVAQFVLPTGYVFTTDLAGDGATDSNPDPITGITPVFTIGADAIDDTVVDTDPETTAGLVNPTIDAGVIPLVAMGDHTWIDTDQDGVQDEEENPLAGVVVSLFDESGEPVLDVTGAPAVATTDEDGYYLIDKLLPGDYVAEFQLPEGYVFTVARAETTSDDSNPDPTDDITLGRTPMFELLPFESGDMIEDGDPDTWAMLVDPTIDAGVVALVAMGDVTWIDLDRDGVQDSGELPLEGVEVTLVESDGTTPVTDVDGNPAAATTDGEGYYFIDALLPGTYRARFVLPTGYLFTTTDGGLDPTDSNPDEATGITPEFTIEASEVGNTVADTDAETRALFVDPTVDAGVVTPRRALPTTGSSSAGSLLWLGGLVLLLGAGLTVAARRRFAA